MYDHYGTPSPQLMDSSTCPKLPTRIQEGRAISFGEGGWAVGCGAPDTITKLDIYDMIESRFHFRFGIWKSISNTFSIGTFVLRPAVYSNRGCTRRSPCLPSIKIKAANMQKWEKVNILWPPLIKFAHACSKIQKMSYFQCSQLPVFRCSMVSHYVDYCQHLDFQIFDYQNFGYKYSEWYLDK